jgi:hypothetical protein
MLGVGRHLWEIESGDSFVERLRSEDYEMDPPPEPVRQANLQEDVWRRVASHEGNLFHTVTGLPFTYKVEGTGIWFFRDSKRVNRKLTRAQFDVALFRCPLKSTTEINDLMDYPYLFALLNDKRIRGQAW